MSKKVIQGVAIIFYPESCPVSNIIEYVLPNYPCALSPIHNMDKTEKGELKKAHYHLLFQGNLSAKDKRYISKITGVMWFEPVYDLTGYYDYLIHWSTKDNWYMPNKAHYWSADIQRSERWNDDLLLCDVNNRVDILRDTFKLCGQFTEYSEFIDFLLADDSYSDILDWVLHNHNIVSEYIRSVRHRKLERKIDSTAHIKSLRSKEEFEDSFICTNMLGDSVADLHTYRLAKSQERVQGFNDISFNIDYNDISK